MPTTANTINYYVAADGTLRDGPQGSIAQTPRINYGTDYAVTLSFPPSTIAEGDQLQVALNRSRTFFSSASATGDAPVAAVAKHDVTAEEATAQEVSVVLSTNTRAMIDQVNGIDHPVRGFFGVHVLRGQSFVTLAVADALMMSLESGPDAISPSLPVVDYPTRQEAEALAERSENAAERAEEAAAGIVPPLQLSAPPTTSTSGSVGQLAVWHDSATSKDHLYHLCFVSEGESATLYHWEECVLVSMGNVAGGYPVLDANGRVASGNLPIANEDTYGAISIHSRYGINLSRPNESTPWGLHLKTASNAGIDTRSGEGSGADRYGAVTPLNLDYAVRSVLPNVTVIPAATSDYSLVDSSATTNKHSHVYSHTPTSAPTYRLPQVTNTTVAHYIKLTVDFTNVQTYSFLDYQGEPIVPLFTPSIAAGDVYTFKIEYSAIKAAWLIYPQKQGAVADDYVMRGEVGAANGVAGLDANAKVPSGQLPIATNSSLGLVKGYVNGNYGINIDTNGQARITRAEPTTDILPRTGNFKPIVPSNLNYAVTAALTDANHITLNDAQKATAQEVFGVGGPITAIPAATSAYTLAEGIFTHAPTSAPTYTLPSITDDIRTHEVVLVIDFSSVQTFSFLVDGGGDVTFQSYANPTKGDVWAFRCWWYGGKWRIAPMKIKNCVTRQLANGSLAITDAVGGNALALKMTAPRSVVVNQHINATDTSVTLTSGRTWMTYIGGVGAKVTGEGQSVTCTGGTDMAVDLTQYFNGDTTLINSIQIWDDLVAYDPRFANYVEYNTGTVSGVTPTVKVSGKNLQPKATEPKTVAGVTFTPNEDGSISVSGTPTTEATYFTPNCYFKQGSILTASGISSATNIIWSAFLLYDKDGNNLYNSGGSSSSTLTINTSLYPTAVYMVLRFKRNSNNVATGGKIYPQVEYGSTATAYEPYHDGGSVTAPSTMYGVGSVADTFDALAGKMNRTMASVDLGTLDWASYADASTAFPMGRTYAALSGKKDGQLNIVTSAYVTEYISTVDKVIYGSSSGTNINLIDTALTGKTASQIKAALSGVLLYYELATPTTSQSTPTQISLQAGSNVAMQTDGGRLAPIDITYESDEL